MKPSQPRVLVVDDDAAVVEFLCEMLPERGYLAHGVTSAAAALAWLEANTADLVVSDVVMPTMTGPALMAAIHARAPGQLVILMTAFGSIDLAVQSVRGGAADFVTKPFDLEVLTLAIERALRERQMRREIVRLRANLPRPEGTDLVARSRAMQRVVELATRASRSDSTVLLTGESGVGKGATARLVHARSARANKPFLQVNCAALPVTLIEAELFGARKGAFTDAREDRPGLFRQASTGTLFLDEIGEMPVDVQAKLLHALESGRIRAVGATTDVGVDVRVIAATNQSLEDAMRERRFRPDLYYRLNVIRIDVPALRDRPEDLDGLIDQFLRSTCERLGRPLVGISADALRLLRAHPWPGNVRELANAIERAVALTEHDTLVREDLELSLPPPTGGGGFLAEAAAREWPLAEIERLYVEQVVRSVSGNKAKAARVLGIDRRTIYRKLGEAEPAEE